MEEFHIESDGSMIHNTSNQVDFDFFHIKLERKTLCFETTILGNRSGLLRFLPMQRIRTEELDNHGRGNLDQLEMPNLL